LPTQHSEAWKDVAAGEVSQAANTVGEGGSQMGSVPGVLIS